jgi:hypothetical protein
MSTHKKSVGWLISNVKTNDISSVIDADLASTRLRAGVCVQGLKSSKFINAPLNCYSGYSDILFMSKYVHDSGTGIYLDDGGVRGSIWLNFIKQIKISGGKFIVDYTDHHLGSSGVVSMFYSHILPYVDGFVAPSNMMKKNISAFSNKPVWIIPEPIEVKINLPKDSLVGTERLNILWFGHNSNLPYLFRLIQGPLRNAPPHNLIILSNHLDQSNFLKIAATGNRDAKYSYGKWSLELMEKISKKIDLCVIPGDTNDPKKNGVSSGRLLTALAMGLPTIATPLESYSPFSKFFASDAEPLEFFLSNPLIYKEKILEVQKIIEKNFTVAAVGKQWLNVCNHILNN